MDTNPQTDRKSDKQSKNIDRRYNVDKRNKRIKIIIDSFIDFIIILSPTVGYFVEQEIKGG